MESNIINKLNLVLFPYVTIDMKRNEVAQAN
jgi:hypothetical protein